MATKPVKKMVINNGEDVYIMYSPFETESEFNQFLNGLVTSGQVDTKVANGVDGLRTELSSQIDTEVASGVGGLRTEIGNQKGAANGFASLDSSGKVPSSELPSYVDDVVEYSGTIAFPLTGESGKIYIDTTTNSAYRWSGSQYTKVASDLTLGTTHSNAFYGDYGQVAYTHAQNKGVTVSTLGLYKFKTNSEGHISETAAVTKSDLTALGLAGTEIINGLATEASVNTKAPIANPNFTGSAKLENQNLATQQYADQKAAAMIDDSAADSTLTKTWSISKINGEIAEQLVGSIAGITENVSGRLRIARTFSSVEDMNAYSGSDVVKNDLVLVVPESNQNGKVYIKTDTGYVYISNLTKLVSSSDLDPITDSEIQVLFLDL